MCSAIHTTTTSIAGLHELWAETLGEPQICIAVLDGLADRSHPSLVDAKLTQLEPLVPNIWDRGSAAQLLCFFRFCSNNLTGYCSPTTNFL